MVNLLSLYFQGQLPNIKGNEIFLEWFKSEGQDGVFCTERKNKDIKASIGCRREWLDHLPVG